MKVSLFPATGSRAASVTATAVIALSAASVCIPALGVAADAPPADAAASDSLEEVIVTATRREERLKDVPFSTSVLRGEPLQAIGIAGADIRQLAGAVPSLDVESSNGRTFPRFYIRGYGNTDFTTFASQPVGLVYDDIVQENPALKGFPIFDVKDVEVLRGPQGTLFGRNAPAGVVKIESAKPVLGELSGFGNFADGTYNSATIQGVLNLPLSDTMAMRFSTQELHRNNWVDNTLPNAATQHTLGYDDWGTRIQLLYKPSENFNALFNVHVRTLDGAGLVFRANIIKPGSNGDLVDGFDSSKWSGDGYVGQTYTSVGANARLTWSLPDLTFQSITGYESIRHYNTIGDIDGGYGDGAFSPNPLFGPGFIPFGVETGGLTSNWQWTQEFRVVSTAAGPLQWQAGVFLFDEKVAEAAYDYTVTGSAITDTTISSQKNDAEAIFGSLEYAVTPLFKVRAGLRFTEDHKTFDVPFSNVGGVLATPVHATASASNLSWDLSGTYAVTPDVNLYARVATGFRAPSFGAPSGGLPTQIVRSEDNISYETGVKADILDHKGRVDFDIYYFDVSHQQLTAVGGQSNVTQLLNAAHTIGDGAELEFELRPITGLSLNLSASYNHTEIKDPTLAVGGCFQWGVVGCTELSPPQPGAPGNVLINGDPLPRTAKYMIDASARYGFPVAPGSELYVFGDVSFRTRINLFLDLEKEFSAPSLTQAGLRVGYSWADSKYDVAAYCRNCANVIRLNYGINFDNFTGVTNDPRIIGAQFSAKF